MIAGMRLASASPATDNGTTDHGQAMSPGSRIRHRRCGRSTLRRILEIGVLLSIAGIMANEFLFEGWLVPIVVSSGSMATTLLGPHRVAECPDCGMTFACDADEASQASAAACPNCGRRDIPFDEQVIPGDRLLVDRATFSLRGPRRWEVAMFRCPESSDDYCVKRIVGLPGETVEIRGGDLYVKGEIARKSLAQQREMAVLVHDTAWNGGKRDLPNCWSAESADGWQRDGSGWRCSSGVGHAVRAGQGATASAGTHSVPYDWLSYNHRRPTGSPAAVEESPVLDDDGYNQSASRQLNRVIDLMLVCSMSTVGDGELALKANDGRESFQVSIVTATGAITLARNGRVAQTAQATAGVLSRPTELVLSLIDRQVILAIGGREFINYPFDPDAEAVAGTSKPFSIGSSSLDLQIPRLQVYRDIYYTPAVRASDSKSRHLGPDEYFVLGDNSPISRDSRPWTGGDLVRGSSLVGRLLTVFRRQASGP
jgi:signal peptidase I